MDDLKVLSYNIWFDQYKRIDRLFALIEIIKKANADVVCLQEVLDFQYDTIKERLDYSYSYPNNITQAYGCVILSKHPILNSQTIDLPTTMGRTINIVNISIGTNKFLIANVHFESEFNQTNLTKKEQIKIVGNTLYNFKQNDKELNIILCSDTNITYYDEKYFNENFLTFQDSWIETGSNCDKKYTYDYKKNVYLQIRKIELRCRIDRILHNLTENIKLSKFELLCSTESDIEPSDHFGIMSTYIIN